MKWDLLIFGLGVMTAWLIRFLRLVIPRGGKQAPRHWSKEEDT